MTSDNRSGQESGFVLVFVITLMIPLVVTAAAFSTVMMSRNSEQRVGQDAVLAMLTAETGVDYAIYRARSGVLVSGGTHTYSYGTQRWFRIVPKDLKSDLFDNDGDGDVDEADEDITQVVITGTYRKATHRIAIYIGPMPLLPTVGAAVTCLNPGIKLELGGTPRFSGADTTLAGAPGSGSPVYGVATVAPGTTAYLESELNSIEAAAVDGVGPTPSVTISPAPGLDEFVVQAKNVASQVLAAPSYTDLRIGDSATSTPQVTFRQGDLNVAGTSGGAGVLVVTGNLTVTGTFVFDGLVIVLGGVEQPTGTARIRGAMIQGELGASIRTLGAFEVHYSVEALALANSRAGRFVLYNGWQNVAGY